MPKRRVFYKSALIYCLMKRFDVVSNGLFKVSVRSIYWSNRTPVLMQWSPGPT